jgi:hypothetical protein
MRESVASAKVHDVELGKARATKPTTTHAMKTLNQSTAALAAFLAALVSAHAAPVINGNFCSVANIQDPPAGLVSGSSAWNDLTSTTGGYSASDTSYGSLNAGAAPKNDLKLAGGGDVPAGVSISWSSQAHDTHDGRNSPGFSTVTGHQQLYAGYIMSFNTISISLTGLDLVYNDGNGYRVFLYMDGDFGTAATPVLYSVSTTNFTTGAGQAFYGQDDADFIAVGNDTYKQITSTTPGNYQSGNYVEITGLSGDGTIYITKLGGSGSAVALNGFEVIPEPSTWALIGIGSAFVLWRTRRRNTAA